MKRNTWWAEAGLEMRLDQHKMVAERIGGPDIFEKFPKCKVGACEIPSVANGTKKTENLGLGWHVFS